MRDLLNKLMIIVLILSLATGCQHQSSQSKDHDLLHVKSADREHSKKVIFLLVDSLMAEAIDQGIRQGELPSFKYLIDHGQYYRDMVTSFPTMSVSIDSSLLTGTYPDEHQVPGLVWYSTQEKKLINYGSGPAEIWNHGINRTLADAIVHLNGKHLSSEHSTIYEDLARKHLTSGSINGLIYRGLSDHTLQLPAWVYGPSSLPQLIQVKGPDLLSLGSIANPLENSSKGTPAHNLPDGLPDRMGLTNKYSVEAVKYLVKQNKLPDFLFAYLPDLDQKIHKSGPPGLKGVKEVDKQLDGLLQAFGSRETAMNESIIIIAGDSGMTRLLPKDQNSVIDLPDLFTDYQVLRAGKEVTDETDIILAVNETMAYVYPNHKVKPYEEWARLMTIDPRIDFVSWREGEWIHVLQGGTNKAFMYRAGGRLVDPYQQKWTIKEAVDVLDLSIDEGRGSLKYGDYPDVLRRLSSAHQSHPGDFMVVTAKPGYELADRSSPTHEGGGGHGSIRKDESLIPLIICGTDQRPPEQLRIIDLKGFLLQLLTD
ncbi:alkaline phosphatase family protein [Paenibacillus urinalis]|uniref:Alkaline phosphatase family protein n=1 Tax=Paenibacillus urinalis TaxID=521520 RepID=A0AAX3N0A3_9BACL|nr:alkaline phosphatase family protein [Paenibacillus urinalis]WDH82519.1 alkaline phosphatase family protein [Paenibacillus urinalis]